MKLPHYQNAIIDIRKLKDYCLHPTHPVGKHKARIFKSHLGITQKDAVALKEQILNSLPHSYANKSHEDSFGTRFFVPIQIKNRGKRATVVTIWIIHKHTNIPRLVSCYIKN